MKLKHMSEFERTDIWGEKREILVNMIYGRERKRNTHCYSYEIEKNLVMKEQKKTQGYDLLVKKAEHIKHFVLKVKAMWLHPEGSKVEKGPCFLLKQAVLCILLIVND